MRYAALASLLVACGGGAPSPPAGANAGAGGEAAADAGEGGAAPSNDPEPQLSEADLTLLRGLSPDSLPAPPADSSNAWADDSAAAAFGQALFFDPRFSGQLLDGDNDGSASTLGMRGDVGKVSCAGCHVPDRGFSDTRSIRQQISLAAGWGLRRAPSLLDVGQSRLLMWDGRRDSLFGQVFGVLESEVEMNSSRLFAAHQVLANHRVAYETIFGVLPPLDDPARFPVLAANETGCRHLDANNKCTSHGRGSPGDSAEYDAMAAADRDAVTRVWVNVGKAIGAYQRRLSCGTAPFDAWMHGDETALDRAAERGAGLFVGKAGCISCHSGPYLSDEKFHNVGLQPRLVATVFIDADDPGASVGIAHAQLDPLNVTGEYSDGDDGRLPTKLDATFTGAFRTPRLRCVAERPSFMHTGHLSKLDDVVDFFNRGGDSFGFLGTSELSPLDLTPRERADLVAFLKTLSGAGPSAALLAPP